MSNTNVSTLSPRFSAVVSAFLFLATSVGAGDKSRPRYPNELSGFRFYARYLSPLQPGISDRESVRRVLGGPAVAPRNGWTLNATYTMKGGPPSNPTLGPLAEIILRPGGVIPMGAVKFPKLFTHCHNSLTEINISFDVYSDTSGLEYWLHKEDSQWGHRGDLYMIVYGPRRRSYPPNTIC